MQLDARPGGDLVEPWSDGTRVVVTAGRVTRCEPPVALELTWADDGWPGDTRVAFRLRAAGTGTRLVLEHSGWGVHPAARRKGLVEAHAGGWSSHLKKLVAYAAQRRQ